MPIDKFTARETVRRSVQWRRIGYVMAQERMETYAPQADLTVARWERERLQRIAEPEAVTTPPVGAAVRRYRVEDLPGFRRGKSDGTPGGWHLAGGAIWSDAGAACSPHTPVPGEEVSW